MATNYAAYAGDTLQVTVTALDEAGAPLSLTGCTLTYIITDADGTTVITKSTADGSITTNANVATIAIDAGETTDLTTAYHELECVDTDGNVSTLLADTLIFTPTRIEP